MKNVLQNTLESLRENPTYCGMFHRMEQFAGEVAAEVSDRNDNVSQYVLQIPRRIPKCWSQYKTEDCSRKGD